MENYNMNQTIPQEVSQPAARVVSKISIYIIFAIAMAITGIIATTFPSFLVLVTSDLYSLYRAYIVSVIVSAIVIIPISIALPLMSLKNTSNKKPIALFVFFFIYTVAMGILLSSAFSFSTDDIVQQKIVGYSILITSGVFVLCALMSKIFKNMSGLLPILSSAIVGVLFLVLINWILGSTLITWVVNILLLLYTVGICMYDFHIINKIAGKTTYGNPIVLATYCAFSIYTDFVIMLFRILYILTYLSRRR